LEGDAGRTAGAAVDGDGGVLRFPCDFSVDADATVADVVRASFGVVLVAVAGASLTGVAPLFFLKSDKSLVTRLPIGATFFAELPGRFNGSNVFFTGVVVEAREVDARGDAMDFRPEALVLANVGDRSSRHLRRVRAKTVGDVADAFWAAICETRG
jgi:hypothetical protein